MASLLFVYLVVTSWLHESKAYLIHGISKFSCYLAFEEMDSLVLMSAL